MRALIASNPSDQERLIAKSASRRRSSQELEMRGSIEAWGRACFPDARVVHELVVGRGEARADVAFVQPSRLVAVEIKSDYDVTDRLLAQVGWFTLSVGEVWVCYGERWGQRDTSHVDLICHLLPSLGRLRFHERPERRIEIEREAQPFAADPAARLALLWVAELQAEAVRHRLLAPSKRPPTHDHLTKLLLDKLTPAEQVAAVCRQLRARRAFWRADPPMIEGAA